MSNPIYKIVLVGDTAVGKSSILQRFSSNTFVEGSERATALDSKICTVDIGDGRKVDLHIWDTAGQEKFSTLTATYYRDASGSVVVFDLTNQESFGDVGHWLEDTDRYAKEEICKILVGNKSDLQTERVMKHDRGKALAYSKGIQYVECSAKDGTNIQDIFITLAKELAGKDIKQLDRSKSIKINSTIKEDNPGKRKWCVI